MAYTASKLIEIATTEIGYHEKASNSNLDSKTANSGTISATEVNIMDNKEYSGLLEEE